MKWPIIIRRVSGHSMLPVLPPGTYVFGMRLFKKLNVGDTVIFLHDGKEKIKRIGHIDGPRLFVIGDHPEASVDSRQFGLIEASTVMAKVFWPHAPKTRAENVEASET